MVNLSGFHVTRTIIDVNFDEYSLDLQQIISAVSHSDKLVAQDVILWSKEPYEFNPDAEMSFSLLASLGIGFFDYLICAWMWNKPELRQYCVWESGHDDFELNENLYPKAIFVAYFLLMTRAKCDLFSNEPIPKFISNYIGIKVSKEEIRIHLGRNDFTKLNYSWIKSIRWSGFSSATIARLNAGIAGTRLFNVIAQYDIDRENVPNELVNIYNAVKRVAVRGPFWSQHPFFYPESLKGVSILKNLGNLIVSCLSQATLNKLSATKATFGVLKIDERYNQYKTWAQGFEELFLDKDKVSNYVNIVEDDEVNPLSDSINDQPRRSNNNNRNNDNNNNNNDGDQSGPSFII